MLRKRTGLVWRLKWRRVSLILVLSRGGRERQNALIDGRLRPVELEYSRFNRYAGYHLEMRVFSDVHLPPPDIGFPSPDTIT